MKRLEHSAWWVGAGTALVLAVCMVFLLAIGHGTPFSPGPLSAEHPQNRTLGEMASHAEFESQCDRCHTPFRGPDAARCNECHRDVKEELSTGKGLHAGLLDAQNCKECHPDHNGRVASLTRKTISDLPHNQYGFTLLFHQHDYDGSPLLCRSCHPEGRKPSANKATIQNTCVDCHKRADTRFVADHSKQFGNACLACHDGSDRLRGFDHKVAYALDQKHAQVECTRCHVNDRYRGTPRECVLCHLDPQAHRGQFGKDCASCHTASGWRPARLVKHSFPLEHGNRGKDSACRVCHPANYGAYTCYGCHDHIGSEIKSEHIRWNKWDADCVRCHQTGKRNE